MTKAERFANAHGVQHKGTSYNVDGLSVIARFAYGKTRDVFAADACNYSYREFWF